MIKVCHMTSVHKSNDVRIFYKECVSLAANGYDTYLVACGESREEYGVHVVGIGEQPVSRKERMIKTTKSIYNKALELDADIYHFHDPELLPYGLKLKKKGKKVIFDSHEKYTEQLKNKPYLSHGIMTCIAGMYGVYEKNAIKKFDAIVFPCTMNGVNPFEGQCKRVAIISNVALLNEFYDKSYQQTEKTENSVCYVGGLSEPRGITVDIKAAYLAGAKLLLAGTFVTEEYEKKLREMPEFSCVEYCGQLDREEVALLLSRCRVGLFTLLNMGQYLKIDTFGIKVYEYMSMGLPVVISDSAYNRKTIDKYKFGICVNPDSEEDIANAIRYLLDNPEEAKKMGENGRRAIKEEFNWSIEEKKLLALYESVSKE